VPRHLGATAVVFRDALWIIGGADEKTQTHGNDIWFSGNGITWSEMQPKSVFPPRAWHSTVVFRDRIWVIGGRDNTGYRNDVWSSDDGISWVQAKPAAEFSPRSDQASFVYKDKIWMIGGRDRTGDLTEVWNSDDGSNWTQVAVPAAFEGGNPVSAVTFDGRIWVIQIPHTWGIASPWATARPSGIWYSYDGIAWTKVDSSPEFFSDKYSGGEPFLIVFQNRFYVLQRYNGYTGIWYTMPQGQMS
jgi:leucine-zipper-like transcriptional regulator 1